MTLETIREIGNMLREKKEKAYFDYQNIRYNLEQKYKTEWIDKVISKSERETLDKARNEHYRLTDIFEDFENHQW